ncbi:MAG TPA: hypothetical protein VMM16_03040 [Verrucomicrobiae bacterium]|nr:hypothetical protein [Verrucomicrobiae bacterium]
MKRFLGLTILAAGLAMPAHAQSHAPAGAAGGPSSANSSGGGGGYGGGWGSSGGTRLTQYPLAHFAVTSVSGSQQDYVPSTFVAYNQAISHGQEILDAPPKTVAEAARENSIARMQKARVVVVQGPNGEMVVTSR